MKDFDEFSAIERIEELRNQKMWSYYELSKRSEIGLTALRAMVTKPHIPTIKNLYKLCVGFEISLSEFFSYCDKDFKNQDKIEETKDVKILLELWNCIDCNLQKNILYYMKGLAKQPLTKEYETI